jgi:chloride channel protein, CIC family
MAIHRSHHRGNNRAAIAVIILREVRPPVLTHYLHHHWAIVPGVTLGFVITGLIMQFLTPDPDAHSAEEIIRSYHEDGGKIDMRPFFAKLFAAVTTVGSGGSAHWRDPASTEVAPSARGC